MNLHVVSNGPREKTEKKKRIKLHFFKLVDRSRSNIKKLREDMELKLAHRKSIFQSAGGRAGGICRQGFYKIIPFCQSVSYHSAMNPIQQVFKQSGCAPPFMKGSLHNKR